MRMYNFTAFGASFLVAEKSVRKIFPEKKMIAGGVRWHRERLRYAE